jgi:hypothetical protein
MTWATSLGTMIAEVDAYTCRFSRSHQPIEERGVPRQPAVILAVSAEVQDGAESVDRTRP